MRTRSIAALITVVMGLALALAGCTTNKWEAKPDNGKTLTIATSDSWAMSQRLIEEFQAKTGIKLTFEPQGDAAELVDKLALTKGTPLADAVFGIDNTSVTPAVRDGVLAPYAPADLPPTAQEFALQGNGAKELTPIDYGDVCINVDDAWFAKKGIAPPKTFADLADPRYKNLLVVPGATTSSPGLAFLVATIGTYGNGWKNYWQKLVANGVKIDARWEDAYSEDFTGGGGNGDRPIVLSYSYSPPLSVHQRGEKPTSRALLDTCFRQVEYAGVLKGADNPKGAEQFIDFMLGKHFQAALPYNMYVYPVDTSVTLPRAWKAWAPTSPHPVDVPAEKITAHRTEWLRDWRKITSP